MKPGPCAGCTPSTSKCSRETIPTGSTRGAVVAEINKKLSTFERHLADGRPFLLGDQFSVADAYFFVVASWTGPTNIGLADWPNVAAYVDRIAARPATKAAMRAEGLIQ